MDKEEQTFGISAGEADGRHAIQPIAIRLAVIAGVSVFVVEALVMGFLRFFPQFSDAHIAILDSFLMVLFLYPVQYWFFVRPLLNSMRERSAAQVSLGESEARYRSLFEGNCAVMLLIEPLTRTIIDVNQAAVNYYGYVARDLSSGVHKR